jgi:hypothetical protein
MAKKKTDFIYVTLRVKRPLNDEEIDYINRIENPTHQAWELDRQSMLFEIAVLAIDEASAIRQLRALLRSPRLVVELRNGRRKKQDVQEIPPTKSKGGRI